MSKNHIYKITVLNWIEHNPGTKKHFKKTLIANNLTSDAKINALPLSCKWLFINLLLICGDYAKDTVTLTERQVNDILTTKEGPQNALDRLASFQLVSYEKNEFLRIEKKEKKRIERKEIITSEQKNQNVSTQSANAVDVVVVPKFKLKLSSTKEIELKQDLVNSWQDTYPKEFLDLSLKEMRNWLLANEAKSPKSQWPRFINSWFRRGWERHRLTIKSQPAKMTLEDFEEIMRGGL